MRNKFKLKKGDEVIVLAGKDKGKVGKITKMKPLMSKAIVSGINKVKKHQKPDGINAPNIFGVMGKGNAKLLKEKIIVNKIAKKILLRYFRSLDNKSAKELLDDTDCIIEILPKEFSNWKY